MFKSIALLVAGLSATSALASQNSQGFHATHEGEVVMKVESKFNDADMQDRAYEVKCHVSAKIQKTETEFSYTRSWIRCQDGTIKFDAGQVFAIRGSDLYIGETKAGTIAADGTVVVQLGWELKRFAFTQSIKTDEEKKCQMPKTEYKEYALQHGLTLKFTPAEKGGYRVERAFSAEDLYDKAVAIPNCTYNNAYRPVNKFVNLEVFAGDLAAK